MKYIGIKVILQWEYRKFLDAAWIFRFQLQHMYIVKAICIVKVFIVKM